MGMCHRWKSVSLDGEWTEPLARNGMGRKAFECVRGGRLRRSSSWVWRAVPGPAARRLGDVMPHFHLLCWDHERRLSGPPRRQRELNPAALCRSNRVPGIGSV